jgi:phosphoribosylformylglycinamidine synthase
VAYRTPLISGKDSLSSDRVIDGVKYSIKPTLLVSAIAVVKDVRKAVTMDVKQPRHHVYVLGLTKNELGGSAFYRIKGYVGNNVPKVNAELARKLYETLNHAMEQEIIESCHDCSDGGLAVALAESAFAGNFGMKLSLSTMLDDAACDIDYNYQLLFSESPSRFVVTVRPACVRRFERMFAELPYARLGRTTSESRLVIEGLNNEKVVDVPISRLKDAWQRTLRW